MATAIVIAVAAFLTWWSGDVRVDAQSFGVQDFTGIGGEEIDRAGQYEDIGGMGFLTLFLAILVFAFAVVRACGKLSLTAAILGVAMGALIALIAVAGIGVEEPISATDQATGEEVDVRLVGKSIGVGLWMTLVAGVAMVVLSIVGIVKRR